MEKSETKKKFPQSERLILKRTLSATLFLILLLIGMYLFGIFTFALDLNASTVVIGSTILLVLFAAAVYERYYFSSYFYDLTDHYLIIKKDPVLPREIVVPYERIVSVELARDLFDRMLGLWDLHINTKTSPHLGMQAHVDGLAKEAANGLKAAVEAKMAENKAKNL